MGGNRQIRLNRVVAGVLQLVACYDDSFTSPLCVFHLDMNLVVTIRTTQVKWVIPGDVLNRVATPAV